MKNQIWIDFGDSVEQSLLGCDNNLRLQINIWIGSIATNNFDQQTSRSERVGEQEKAIQTRVYHQILEICSAANSNLHTHQFIHLYI